MAAGGPTRSVEQHGLGERQPAVQPPGVQATAPCASSSTSPLLTTPRARLLAHLVRRHQPHARGGQRSERGVQQL